MNLNDKRKLVATIGPASDDYEIMKELIKNGASCLRVNFSHGNKDEHARRFLLARTISKELKMPISLMLDTKGPEIRVGQIKNDFQVIPAEKEINIFCSQEKYNTLQGDENSLAVSYDMSQDLKVGDKVLFDDGKLIAAVIDVKEELVKVKTLNSHTLKSNKRINLPGVDFSLPFLSTKDIEDIKFGIQHNIDYIAASFVNSANDINELKKLLKENNASNIKIIAKIESILGIQNINEIIKVADGIMIARGDLGLEIPYYKVPFYQRQIIKKCNKAACPVIVATQMLDSMEHSLIPTRAEVTDVYNAILQGADAVMLSGETASGLYPIEAVKVMKTISSFAEKEFYELQNYENYLTNIGHKKTNNTALLFKIIKKLQNNNCQKVVVLFTANSNLLNIFSKYKPDISVIVITKSKKIINSFGINSNITRVITTDNFALFGKDKIFDLLHNLGLQKNDKFIIVKNNNLEVHTL